MFGTTDGQIIVMSSTGAMVSQVTVHDGMEISAMAWSCERFNMEEVEFTDDNHRTEQGGSHACVVHQTFFLGIRLWFKHAVLDT